MKKIFISCPMKGRTDEAIKKTMDKMHKYAELVLDEELEVIPSFITDAPPSCKNKSVWYLGESIKLLSDADVFVGLDMPYWVDARGCDIEEMTAYRYGIKKISISRDDFEYFCPDLANEPRYDVPTCAEPLPKVEAEL